MVGLGLPKPGGTSAAPASTPELVREFILAWFPLMAIDVRASRKGETKEMRTVARMQNEAKVITVLLAVQSAVSLRESGQCPGLQTLGFSGP